VYTQGDIWSGGSMFDHGFTLNSSLNMTPQIISESATSYSNSELMYPGSASQGFVNKNNVQYGSDGSWIPHRSTEVPRGLSVHGSNRDSNSSHSPKSHVSEVPSSEKLPFTLDHTGDAGSENTNWSSYSAHSYTVGKASSPGNQNAIVNKVPTIDFARVPPLGLGISVPSATPVGSSQHFNGIPLFGDGNSQYDTDYSYSQKSSPADSPWYSEDGSLSMAAMPYRPREPPTSKAPINSLPAGFQFCVDGHSSSALVALEEAHPNVPARNHFRSSVQGPRALDAHAQRKADDEILLDGKKKGLTYKEIRRSMHSKCAESTLRGRYRSLTKARQDRVRKPVWRSKDVSQWRITAQLVANNAKVELLTEFVMQDLDRVDASHHHALSYQQRLAKVQWKKAAESIHAHGGSYHFGNSTCKRKWQELHPGP
jgi:hypothetical protein